MSLVGREAELERIAAARERGGTGIVIGGQAGAGKSRLAREALADAERRGTYTEWVQATRSAAAVPLGAFAGLLADPRRGCVAVADARVCPRVARPGG